MNGYFLFRHTGYVFMISKIHHIAYCEFITHHTLKKNLCTSSLLQNSTLNMRDNLL